MAKTFPGGVHPDDGKSLSKKCAIQELPLPTKVVLPVRQHIGAPAKVIVKKGDHVKKGQVVAEAGGFVSAPGACFCIRYGYRCRSPLYSSRDQSGKCRYRER